MTRIEYAEQRVNQYMTAKYVMNYIVTGASFLTDLDKVFLLKSPQYENFCMLSIREEKDSQGIII